MEFFDVIDKIFLDPLMQAFTCINQFTVQANGLSIGLGFIFVGFTLLNIVLANISR